MAQQRLQLNLTANTSGFTGALNTASSKLQKFGGKLKSIGSSMQKFALPLALAGGASVKMALDFDKSMTKIKALVGIAGGTVDEMGQKVKQFAIDTGTSSREAADALYFITSAGLRTKLALDTLEISLQAAAAGLGDTVTIARLNTAAMAAYGKENLTTAAATDVLVAAVKEGRLDSTQLGQAMEQVVPIASEMGIEFNELGAAFAAVSRTNSNASIAATGLRSVLVSLLSPSTQAREALEGMGLGADFIRQNIKDNGLLNTLQLLAERFDGNADSTTAVFGNVRALLPVMSLTGKNAKEVEGIFARMENTLGMTAGAFKITEQSASHKFKKSLNAAKETLQSLGQQLLVAVVPAVQKLVGFIQNLWKRFKELNPMTQKLVLALGGVAIALPTIITLVGSLVGLLGTLLSPIGLVVAGLAAVAYVIYKNWGEVLPVVVGLYNRFVDLYNSSKFVRVAIAGIGSVFKGVFTKVKAQISQVVNAFSTMWKLIKEFSDEGIDGAFGDILKEGFDNAKTIASDAAKEVAKDFSDSYSKALSNTLEYKTAEQVQGSLDNLKEKFKGWGTNILGGIFSGGVGSTSTDGDGTDGDGTIIPSGGDGDDPVTGAIEEKIGLLEKLGWTAEDTAMSIQNSFSQLGMSIVESMGLAGTALGDFLNNFMNMVSEYLAGQLQMMLADNQRATTKTSTDAMAMASDSALTAVLGANAAAKIAASTGASVGHAVEGAGQTAKSFGPLAAFVLPALIAAGIAAVMSGLKKGKTKKFAKGGIISTPTMGLMGEYPGARSNPEVVAPLDRLKGLIGANNRPQQVNVGGAFELRGQDLIVALERANTTRDRIL